MAKCSECRYKRDGVMLNENQLCLVLKALTTYASERFGAEPPGDKRVEWEARLLSEATNKLEVKYHELTRKTGHRVGTTVCKHGVATDLLCHDCEVERAQR